MTREQLIERCKDYQDLSAMGYWKAQRFRDHGGDDALTRLAQDRASLHSARARRILLYLVSGDTRELFEP
jgi:hypothetical protein